MIPDLYQILTIFSLVRSRTLKRTGHSYGIRDVRKSYNFDKETFWKEVTSYVEEKIGNH
jgi:hypothetical protein